MKNNRDFTRMISKGGSDSFNIPLGLKGLKYKINDIRINLIDRDGNLLDNTREFVTIMVDNFRIKDKVIAGSETGKQVSLLANTVVDATSEISISCNTNSFVTAPLEYETAITFFVTED